MDRHNRQIDLLSDGAHPLDIREMVPRCDNDEPFRPGCPPTPGPPTGPDRSDEQGNGGDSTGPPPGMTVEDRRGITELERGRRRVHDGKLAEFCVATHW